MLLKYPLRYRKIKEHNHVNKQVELQKLSAIYILNTMEYISLDYKKKPEEKNKAQNLFESSKNQLEVIINQFGMKGS